MSLNILFNKSAISNLVFIDFVSVTKYPSLSELEKNDPTGFSLWKKSNSSNDDNENLYHSQTCFNPYFSKIVGASVGAFAKGESDEMIIKTKQMSGDETKILGTLSSVLYNAYEKDKILAGHNISGYHIPFYTKRFLARENVNKIITKDLKGETVIASYPAILAEHLIAKPWEQKILDTLQVTKFGDYGSSLESLMYHFNVENNILKMRKEDASKFYWQNTLADVTPDTVSKSMTDIAAEYVIGSMKVYQYLREGL